MEPVSPYQMCINNIKEYLNASKKTPKDFDAFRISEVIAIAFCMSKEKVIVDILKK